jgi:hypothetical protein
LHYCTLASQKRHGHLNLCEAELKAIEAYRFYKSFAKHNGSGQIYLDALNTSYRWMFQFNHAALSFIRGQCENLQLIILEEETLEVKETVEVN